MGRCYWHRYLMILYEAAVCGRRAASTFLKPIFEQEQNMIIYLCAECYNTIKNDKGYTLRKPPVEKTKCKMCGRMCFGYGIEIKDVEGK